MKAFNKTRLLALILALSLILSMVAGVSVYAAGSEADAGCAGVVSKNVDLGTELALCFAVKNGSEAGELSLLIWDWTYEGTEYTYETAQQKKAPVTDVVVPDGADCVFVSNRISAKDLDGELKFRTCIEKEDGTCVLGELLTYSIIEYANQRLSEVDGEDKTDEEKANEKELYNYIKMYNLAAEAVLGKGAEPSAD